MISIFDEYGDYYDLIYSDKKYLAEAKYINNILKSQGISKGNILEFGSGTGKHGTLLSNFGYKVHGIELSSKMFNIANKLSKKNFSCQQGDITEVNLNKKYDAVFSLFHVMSYQTTNEKLQKAFENASRHLKSGGLFIFDFWYSPAVYHLVPSVQVKRVNKSGQKITRIAEPTIFQNENRIDVKYNIFAQEKKTGYIKNFQEIHSLRHFSLPELITLADINGFKCLKAEEFLTSSFPSEDTWGVCIVLKKYSR